MLRLKVRLALAVTSAWWCGCSLAASAYGADTCPSAADAPLLPSPGRGGGASDLEDPDSLSLLQQQHIIRTSAIVRRRLRRRQPPGQGGKGPFVAILSAAGNDKRRAQVRKKCLKELHKHNIPYLFFVGRPSYPGRTSPRIQGAKATLKETEVLKQLRKEQHQFKDIRVVPYADHYSDLSDKVALMFDYALDAGYDLIAKIDDDQCLNFNPLVKVANQTKDDVGLYVGAYLWNGTEFPIMEGATGERVPYMGGPCYMLSRRLAGIVYRDRAFETEMYQEYGTNSEDNNMGRWYERAVEAQRKEALFKDVRFERRVEPRLCSSALEAGHAAFQRRAHVKASPVR